MKMEIKLRPYKSITLENLNLLINKTGKWLTISGESLDKINNNLIEEDPNLFKQLKEKEFIYDPNCKYNFPVKKYSFLCQGPSLHVVILTDLCNLNCIYCQASSLKEDKHAKKMKKETAKKVVDFIFKSQSNHITIEFQGGEPLLNYNVLQFIIEYAKTLNLEHKKDLRFAFVTNFELLDQEKLEYLTKNKVGLCTSFDGPKKLHDFQRKSFRKSNYDTISEWIKKIKSLKEQNKIPKNYVINALATITKKSFDYYKEIVDEYIKHGFNIIHLRNLNQLGSADKSWQEIGYTTQEFIDFWKTTMDYIIELNKKGIDIKERLVIIILKKILLDFQPNYTEQRSPCGACISQLAYDVDGNIYSCDEARMIDDNLFKIGTVDQEPGEVITSENAISIVLSSINDLQQCDDCIWQPYCGLCPVLNYANYNSLIVDVNKTMRCKIFKAQFEYIFRKLLFDEQAKNIFINWLKT